MDGREFQICGAACWKERLESLQREGILGLSRVINLEDRVMAQCAITPHALILLNSRS